MAWVSSTNGWGPVERDRNVGGSNAGDGTTLSINGTTFTKGLGTNSVSDVVVSVGTATTFTAKVGVDDMAAYNGTVVFSVIADGVTLWTSPLMKGKQSAVSVSVSVSGRKQLTLHVSDGGDNNYNDNADWAQAALVTTTASPSPTASPTPSTPSGQAAPTGDLPGWKMQMVEDFKTAAPIGSFMTAYTNTIQSYQDGWTDTSKHGTYMPSKVVSAHDGMMDYYLHTENGVHMVAAEMPKLPNGKYGQLYGRYSVRFKNDSVPGYKSAWLLWPNSESWPNDGEIDFPEANLTTSSTIDAFAHYASPNGGQDWFGSSTPMAGAWHTATVEWAPGSVTFYLDGTKQGTSTTMTPSTAMHWVLQTETALDGTVPADSVSGHVLIDWVAQWSRV